MAGIRSKGSGPRARTSLNAGTIPIPDHWPRHAREWGKVGPPLRPVTADLEVMMAEVSSLAADRTAAALRVLGLGVTPSS
jgi:hypothetical protein